MVVGGIAGRVSAQPQALAQQRHAGVADAGLQGGAVGKQRPATSRRHLAQFRQYCAQPAVQWVLRSRTLEQAGDRTLRQRVVQGPQAARLLDLTRIEIPVRIQRGRIDLAPVQVQQRGEAGVGGQQVELGALLRGRLRIAEHAAATLQFAQRVVFRVEAVTSHITQCGE